MTRADRDPDAGPGVQGAAVDEVGGGGVLDGVAGRLVDGELVGEVRPGRVPARTSPTSVRVAGSRPWSSWAPAGGGLAAAPRHSTKTRPARMVAGSSWDRSCPRPSSGGCRGRASPAPRMGSRASVQQQTTSAPVTASSNEATARAAGWAAARASAWPGCGRPRGCRGSRAPAGTRPGGSGPTPAPRMASTAASGRARAPAATAAVAPVRAAVMRVPSMTATGVPSSGSNSAISAWWEGRPRSWLAGKTLTSLAPRATPGRCTGMAPSPPPSAQVATRGGAVARPALELCRAWPSAAAAAPGRAGRRRPPR